MSGVRGRPASAEAGRPGRHWCAMGEAAPSREGCRRLLPGRGTPDSPSRSLRHRPGGGTPQGPVGQGTLTGPAPSAARTGSARTQWAHGHATGALPQASRPAATVAPTPPWLPRRTPAHRGRVEGSHHRVPPAVSRAKRRLRPLPSSRPAPRRDRVRWPIARRADRPFPRGCRATTPAGYEGDAGRHAGSDGPRRTRHRPRPPRRAGPYAPLPAGRPAGTTAGPAPSIRRSRTSPPTSTRGRCPRARHARCVRSAAASPPATGRRRPRPPSTSTGYGASSSSAACRRRTPGRTSSCAPASRSPRSTSCEGEGRGGRGPAG